MELAAHEANHLSDAALLSSKEAETKSSLALIADGLGEGFMSRAKSNVGHLCTEVGLAAGAGAALSLMGQAGGKWGCASRLIGGTLALGFGADVLRRGNNIYGAYSDTTNNFEGQSIRQKAIADNAGTALFDYPVLALAGMSGARLVSGPRALAHTNEYEQAPSLARPGRSEAVIRWEEFNGKLSTESRTAVHERAADAPRENFGSGSSESAVRWQEFNAKPSVMEWRPGQAAEARPDLLGSKRSWTDGYSEVMGTLEWRPGSKLSAEIQAAHKIDWNLKTEIFLPNGNKALVEKTSLRSFNEPLTFADHIHSFQRQLDPILRETPTTSAGSHGLRITEEITTGTGIKKTSVLYDRSVSIPDALVSYRAINEVLDPHAYTFVPGVNRPGRVNQRHGEVLRPPAELTAEQTTFGSLWRLNNFWQALQAEPQFVAARPPGVAMVLNQVQEGPLVKPTAPGDGR